MHSEWTVSLRDDVAIAAEPDGQLTIGSPYGRLRLKKMPAGFDDVIRRLASPGQEWWQLHDAVRDLGIRNPVARLFYYLQYLSKRGYLVVNVNDGDRPLATLDPTAFGFDLPKESELTGRHVLSRFAFLRNKDGAAVLETPRSAARIVLHDDLLPSFVASLMQPFVVSQFAKETLSFSSDTISQFINLLSAAGMLSPVDDAGVSDEDANPSLAAWEFHDLLFHARSRRGRHDLASGATFRFLGQTDPPPAVAPAVETAGVSCDLYRPDLDAAQASDPPFAQVIESRESCREFDATPLSARQLGEFLFRVGRIRDTFEMEAGADADPDFTMEFTSRPYPAGGSLYELEIYPLVVRCDGVEPGLYRYDALQHRLELAAEPNDAVQQILWDACESTGVEYDQPQVLCILSARFQRISWKYAAIAYALILKHVGVLYQTMYLTATAMGLGGCAIGLGDADAFSEAIHSDYYRETSVGEFLLGTKAHDAVS